MISNQLQLQVRYISKASSKTQFLRPIFKVIYFLVFLSRTNKLQTNVTYSYLLYALLEFFTSALADGSSRTLLSILAVLNYAVVWMASPRPPTFTLFRPFYNPLFTVIKAPITIGTIVTFMFHSFISSLAMLRYLCFFSHFFSLILWSAETAKSTILQILFFFC